MRRLRAVDLCCGAGGWAIAARNLPIEIVAAVDLAHDCCLTYAYNHPAGVVRGNVAQLPIRMDGIDLVLGSIPCEEVSVARNGRELPAEALRAWHELLDGMLLAIQTIRPTYWCIENVEPMKRHLPPLTPQVLLDSASFSGQRRKRLFVGDFPVPKRGHSPATMAEFLTPGPYILNESVRRCSRISKRQWYQKDTRRVLDTSKPSVTITDFGSRRSRGFVVPMKDGRERILQFTEAAALQGFPADYIFVASQSRAWKMVAQAIQIDLGRAILEAIVADAGLERTEAAAYA